MRVFLLALLALAGCRYTFWPPIPAEAPPPDRAVVALRLLAGEAGVRAEVRVVRVPEPGYLEVVWTRDETPLFHRAVFVEGPAELAFDLPHPGKGSYRLVVRFQDETVAAALLGTPTPPKATPPEWKETQSR